MKDYKLVNKIEDVKEYIGDSKIIAFDFETAPDDEYRNNTDAALDSNRAHIVGCSFSIKEDTGIYIPVAHKDGTNINYIDFLNFLIEFLTNNSIIKIPNVIKIGIISLVFLIINIKYIIKKMLKK